MSKNRKHHGDRVSCPGCAGDRDSRGIVRTANLLVEHLVIAEGRKLDSRGVIIWDPA